MLFYSAREVFIAFIFIFCAVRYFQEKDPLKRQRMLSAKWVYIIGIPLTLCIVAENSTVIFLWVPTENDLQSLVLLYFSSRNFSENTLVLEKPLLPRGAGEPGGKRHRIPYLH